MQIFFQTLCVVRVEDYNLFTIIASKEFSRNSNFSASSCNFSENYNDSCIEITPAEVVPK